MCYLCCIIKFKFITIKPCMEVSLFFLNWLTPNWEFSQPLDTFFGRCPFPLLLSRHCPHQQTVQSACVAPNQQWQVRKHAASSGSLLVGWSVKCRVACVLWACLCLSGYSCGHTSISSTSFMHPISSSNGYVLLPQNLLFANASQILGTVRRSWRRGPRKWVDLHKPHLGL